MAKLIHFTIIWRKISEYPFSVIFDRPKINKAKMKQTEKNKIELQIREKIQKLEQEILTLKDLTQPISPDSAIGRVSRMDAINNKSVNEAALRKKQSQFIALKETVKKLDDPNFGKCIKCGAEIPIGRIMIMPESKKCVRCASR